jgi:hypothetical protein
MDSAMDSAMDSLGGERKRKERERINQSSRLLTMSDHNVSKLQNKSAFEKNKNKPKLTP